MCAQIILTLVTKFSYKIIGYLDDLCKKPSADLKSKHAFLKVNPMTLQWRRSVGER